MHGEIRRMRDLAAVALCSLLFLAPVARAADEAAAGETPELKERCLNCHDDPELKDDAGKSYNLSAADYKASAHRGVDCGECHTDALTIKHPRKGQLGPVSSETCIGCHEDEFKAVGASVHGKEGDGAKKACVNCHGNLHLTLKASKPESAVAPANQIRSCGSCHKGMMDKFLSSVHARALLVSGLNSAPSCSSCHTAHDVQPKSNPEANNSRQKTPETCAKCHEGILRLWNESKHGELWQQGDPKGPTCATCHDAHAIKRPTGIDVRAHMPSDCGNCHKEVYKSFHDSFHGKATSLGREAAAMCSDCHTPHHNLPASDPKSSIHKDNLAKTCGNCHKNVNPGFLTFDPHANPSDPKRNVYVYWVWAFMTALLLGVFAFFGIHDLLWLQRALVGRLRGEFKVSHGGPGPYVRRFTVTQKWVHVSIIVSFLMLAATGLPLKFAAASWAPGVMDALGGPATAGWLHRVAAVITFGYFGFHLLNMLYDMVVRKQKGYLWGPRSMVPQLKDGIDLWENLKYFLYLGPRPKLDRWAYWEKFDYLAVFWGVAIIGFSGLMLWFPTFFTQYVPGWVLNAAYVTHSDEALLATGFIFLFHFFHTHLRPEAFPMDPVIFTGRMTLERFKEERPLEYERAVKEGRLEGMMTVPPTGEEITRAYVFGFLAVAIGIALAVGIFIAVASGLVH